MLGIGILLVPRFYATRVSKERTTPLTHIYDIEEDDYRPLHWRYPFIHTEGEVTMQWISSNQSLLLLATTPQSTLSPTTLPSSSSTTASSSVQSMMTNAYVLHLSSLLDRSKPKGVKQLPDTITQWLCLPNVIPHRIKFIRSVVQSF
jgi:hypothetical protein